jgi:hypothetical protein
MWRSTRAGDGVLVLSPTVCGVTEYNDAKSNWGVTFGLQSYERWIALNQSGVLAHTRPLAGEVARWSGEAVESAIGSATDVSSDIAPMVDANHLMLAPFSGV